MYYFKYKINKGDKKEVWFSEQDMDLLSMIWDYKILSLYQIKYFSERLYGIKESTIERKMQRWREGKIVQVKRYTKAPGAQKHYRIGPEGVLVLQQLGLVRSDQKSEVDTFFSRQLKNYDHFFGVRDVVLQAIIHLKKNNKEYYSLNPSNIPYFEKGMEGTSPLIVPDWILSSKHGLLNIEVDRGTENLSMLGEKLKKYIKYVSQHSNEVHHVLFLVIDDGDKALKYINEMPKDRSGRVANIKDLVITSGAHLQPNLNLFVDIISNSGQIAYKVLTGEYPASAMRRSSEIGAAINLLTCYPAFNGDMERLDTNDFYLAEVDSTLYADGHYLLKREDSDNEVILIKLMDKGSIKSLDQIEYLNRLQEEKRFKRKVDKIIAVYRYNDELENDVLGRVLPNIYFTSIEQLGLDIGNPPPLYQTINLVRKEVVTLDDGGN